MLLAMNPPLIAATVSLCLLLILGAVVARLGLVGWMVRLPADRRGQWQWTKLVEVPLADQRYTPQGLAWVDGRLLLANTWKNTRSRVYQYDPESMEILRTFDMPPEAVHTSGLTWDGEHLWAVDYKSNRCYCLDLQASLDTGQVQVVGSFDTTLRGTSACCLVPWGDETRLLISDFMRTKRSYFVDHRRAIERGTALGAIDFSYRNGGFSQGLEYFRGWLWESENRKGRDIVNQIDMARLMETADWRLATVRQFDAPHEGVEDLAWDGRRLWTTDEVDFHFYHIELDVPAAEETRDG